MKQLRLSTKEAQMLAIIKTERSYTLSGVHYLIQNKPKEIGAQKIGGRWYLDRRKWLTYLNVV